MGTIGVDFGGTWIRAAFVDSKGNSSEVCRVQTQSKRKAESILADLTGLIERARAGGTESVDSIGIAIPTTLDNKNRLAPCPNLPTMSAFPLVEKLEQKFIEPVWIENDARCFAVGEWRFGRGRNFTTIAGVTLGTSVGLGVIAQGSLLTGAHCQAGEIWRSPVRIDISGEQEEKLTVHDLLKGQALEEIYHRICGKCRTAPEIASSARANDGPSIDAFCEYGIFLGTTLSWVCNIIDPELIVVGGSVAKAFHLFAPAAREALGRADIILIDTELGDRAAVLGAAYGAAQAGITG